MGGSIPHFNQDYHEAVKYYKKAAEQGDTNAQNKLKQLGLS